MKCTARQPFIFIISGYAVKSNRNMTNGAHDTANNMMIIDTLVLTTEFLFLIVVLMFEGSLFWLKVLRFETNLQMIV